MLYIWRDIWVQTKISRILSLLFRNPLYMAYLYDQPYTSSCPHTPVSHPCFSLLTMFKSVFTSSAVSAGRRIDSTSSAPCLLSTHSAVLKLVLRLPGLDDTIRAAIQSYFHGTLKYDIQAISEAPTGMGAVSDVSGHLDPLKHSFL